MRWPQIVMIILTVLDLLLELEHHGEPETGEHNFWISVIAAVINFIILKAGGFF